jgi:hypothetical protein
MLVESVYKLATIRVSIWLSSDVRIAHCRMNGGLAPFWWSNKKKNISSRSRLPPGKYNSYCETIRLESLSLWKEVANQPSTEQQMTLTQISMSGLRYWITEVTFLLAYDRLDDPWSQMRGSEKRRRLVAMFLFGEGFQQLSN